MDEYDDVNEFAKSGGFDNAADLFRLIASIPIDTPEQLDAFEKWKENDGTKKGLQDIAWKYFGVDL